MFFGKFIQWLNGGRGGGYQEYNIFLSCGIFLALLGILNALLMLRKLLFGPASSQQLNLSLLVVRVGIGFFMLTHGHDKLHYLLEGQSADFPDPLHVGATASHALTVFAEFFCSLFVMIGLFTRLAAAVLVVETAIIAWVMHAGESLGDKEHALMFLVVFLGIALSGAGRYSLDAKWIK